MNTKKLLRLSIVSLCLFVAVALLFPSSALAKGIDGADTVKQGEVLDKSLFMSGTAVVMDGVINGDLVTVGDQVTINGEVAGSLFVIGKTVTLNGSVGGTAYVAALKLELGPTTSIERDLLFLGGSLTTQTDSSINRNLIAISLEANLSGTTGGEVNALVGPLNVIQGIYNFLLEKGWLPKPLVLNPQYFQVGFDGQPVLGMAFGLTSLQNLVLNTPSPAGGQVLRFSTVTQASQQAAAIDVEALKGWAVPFLRALIALLIVGLLSVWLVPAQTSWTAEQIRIHPWRALLNGLVVFVIGWLAAVLLFLLVLALAIFLYWISLPNLAFLVGTLGLSALGVGVAIFWFSILIFSKVIVAYLVGKLLFKRFLPKYAQGRVWPLITGVFLYALLATIPYLGWLVMVLATLFGLGALWMVTGRRKKVENLSPVQPQPTTEELVTSEPVEI